MDEKHKENYFLPKSLYPAKLSIRYNNKYRHSQTCKLSKKVVFHIPLFINLWRLCIAIMKENQEKERPGIEKIEDPTTKE